MRIRNSIVVFGLWLAGFGIANSASHESPLHKLNWLAGCWIHDESEHGNLEVWMPVSGDSMLGMNRTVKGEKTRAFEYMQLRLNAKQQLEFVAWPSGRDETAFQTIRLSDTEAAFENTANDFPHRVVYQRDGKSRLKAYIEGTIKGESKRIDFPMRKVRCDKALKTG